MRPDGFGPSVRSELNMHAHREPHRDDQPRHDRRIADDPVEQAARPPRLDISCVNGGNFGNTRSTAAWLGRARDGLYGRDVATCAGGQIPNGRALDGPLGLRPYFRVVVLALAGRAPWECAARRAQRRGYDRVW
jgi:hypothetical protein